MGFFAFINFLANKFFLFKVSINTDGSSFKNLHEYVESNFGPIEIIGYSPCKYLFLILVFNTAASFLGLVPISKHKSESSIPDIPLLKV